MNDSKFKLNAYSNNQGKTIQITWDSSDTQSFEHTFSLFLEYYDTYS